MNGVLIKPLITEKMTKTGEKLNQFGFVVERNATKDEIREEVEKMYSVEVVRVNTMVYAGKRFQRFTKSGIVNGKKSAFKKAIITLKEGQSIDFFEAV
jgi:large subunit ribosomal protein L23